MKVVRYSVQEHPDGQAVMEVCAGFFSAGACRFELWCQCMHSSGGPLQSVVKVLGTLPDALAVCDVLEAAQGGVREVSDGVDSVQVFHGGFSCAPF